MGKDTGMKKEELLEHIAPCSLMCYTCSAYEKGVICETAGKLLMYMEGVQEFYEKHNPGAADDHAVFIKELERSCMGVCSGCRNREHHGCSIEGCFILECTKEHQVDFCGECDEFPCKKTGPLFEEEVYLQWRKGNEEIREWGIERFWERHHETPHYQAYKQKSRVKENDKRSSEK